MMYKVSEVEVNAPRARLQSGRKASTISQMKLNSLSRLLQLYRASANNARHFLYGEPSMSLHKSPMSTRKWRTFLRMRAAGSEVRGHGCITSLCV